MPVTLTLEPGRSQWRVESSPGGLATALRAVAAAREFTWIGWPGTEVPAGERNEVERQLAEHADAVPIFMDADEYEGFYEHFSNRVLWPLLHNLPQPREFSRDAWHAYQEVNQRFADAIVRRARPGDSIWVHDYQLALVPHMLRERGLECPLGYFLHIPFPSSETFRALPVREAILSGILGADVIGFHAYEYVSHFRSSALRILGVESDPESMRLPTHQARLEVLPIGIDPKEIEAAKARPEVEDEYAQLRAQYAGKKVVLGVDRLDYTKGLPQKLLAFEELLERDPSIRERVVFIQVAAPSRSGVEEYQALKRECDELVGRINGKYSALDWSPLIYINQHVPRERLTALYRLADVALVTPVRDGMNLVCLEYVAARGADAPGTLILSEFAGAATCLSGARLVNPHNPSQIAAALDEALSTEPSAEAWRHMTEFVHHNTSARWAARFLARLDDVDAASAPQVRRLRLDADAAVRARAAAATRPLFLLDYDGTLRPHTTVPSEAIPSERARAILRKLSRVATVYVISGRPASVLDEWLGDLPIGLVCEHGLATKDPEGQWGPRPQLDRRAIDEVVAPLFDAFTERTPGSRVEHKAASIAWHYRGCDPKFGAWRAKELRSLLESGLAGHPYTVLWGSRVVEVRHVQITKGHAAATLLERHRDADFVFCAGDDRTDEDMFEALAAAGCEPRIVCHVGGVDTGAEFFVESSSELLAQVEALAHLWG